MVLLHDEHDVEYVGLGGQGDTLSVRAALSIATEDVAAAAVGRIIGGVDATSIAER
jgi:hypothetical protein